MSESTQTMSTEDSNTADQDNAPERHAAKRVFATEFNEATFEFRESESEKATKYTLLPTGGRANRVTLVGVLKDISEGEYNNGDPYIRASVHDGTENFYLQATAYQQDALMTLRDIETPTLVSVTGKPRHWQDEDRVDVRPNVISEVDAETRRRWIRETAHHTLDRLERFEANVDDPDKSTRTGLDIFQVQERYSINNRKYLEDIQRVVSQILHLEQ